VILKVNRVGQGLLSCIPLPEYLTRGSAGLDLRAAIEKPVRITPGTWQMIPCGIAVEIPEGYMGEVRSRSGLAVNHGVTVLHGVGTIDSDYRGEMGVPLRNHSGLPYVVEPHDRIAQLVIVAVQHVAVQIAPLSKTERGEGGWGSTGRA